MAEVAVTGCFCQLGALCEPGDGVVQVSLGGSPNVVGRIRSSEPYRIVFVHGIMKISKKARLFQKEVKMKNACSLHRSHRHISAALLHGGKDHCLKHTECNHTRPGKQGNLPWLRLACRAAPHCSAAQPQARLHLLPILVCRQWAKPRGSQSAALATGRGARDFDPGQL